jgi:hypothetical protein
MTAATGQKSRSIARRLRRNARPVVEAGQRAKPCGPAGSAIERSASSGTPYLRNDSNSSVIDAAPVDDRPASFGWVAGVDHMPASSMRSSARVRSIDSAVGAPCGRLLFFIGGVSE